MLRYFKIRGGREQARDLTVTCVKQRCLSVFAYPGHDKVFKRGPHGFMMTTCRHCYPRGPELYLKALPTLLTLVHKIVPTPESDFRPPNYITWDQAAVLKHKWMEINFRTKVLQKTNKGSPCFFFYSHIYLFKSFKIYLFIFGWAGLHCYALTFSGCGQWGRLSSFGALASHLLGFSFHAQHRL